MWCALDCTYGEWAMCTSVYTWVCVCLPGNVSALSEVMIGLTTHLGECGHVWRGLAVGMGVCVCTFQAWLMSLSMSLEAMWSCHLLEGRNIYLINFGAQSMPIRSWSMSRECDLGLMKHEKIAERSGGPEEHIKIGVVREATSTRSTEQTCQRQTWGY